MEYQQTAEATGDLIGNKIAAKITNNLQQNNSEVIINEQNKGIPKQRYISQEEI